VTPAEKRRAPFWVAQAGIDLAAVLLRRGAGSHVTTERNLIAGAVAAAEERGSGRILVHARALVWG